jgi:hypothetical protein
LVAAGWTEVQKTAGQRHIYKSNGEDTTENVNIELNFLGSNQYLHFNLGTKVDASDELEGKVGNNVSTSTGVDTNGRWNLTGSDFTSDFFILCTKDHLFAFFQPAGNETGSAFWVSIGLGKRSNLFNPAKYALANNPVAGDNVFLDVSPGNPLAEGYRPGDIIDIVETAPAEAFAARRLLVTDVSATGFTVFRLPVDFHVGALVGQQPSPLIRGVANNEVPLDTTLWASPYWPVPYAGFDDNRGLADDGNLDQAIQQTYPNGFPLDRNELSDGLAYATSGEYGTGGTPNKRTQRFTCRNLALGGSGELQAVHPFLIAFPATVGLYPHDWFKADRLNPVQYYVGFKPTSGTAERWGVGPTI